MNQHSRHENRQDMTHTYVSSPPAEPNPEWYTLVLTALVLVVAGSFQSSFFTRVSFFGTVPDLLFGTAVAFAYFTGGKWGGIVGACAGLLYDAMCAPAGVSFGMILYFMMGYLLGREVYRMPGKGFRGYLLSLAVSLPVRGLLSAITVIRAYGGLRPLWLFSGLLPELVITFLLSVCLYPLMKKITS